MVQTGLIGDQFSSEWCRFSTITLFNQIIHHNDKVKPKNKLSSFTLRAANES